MSRRVSPPTANEMFLFPHERTHASERVEYPSSRRILRTDKVPQALHLLAPPELDELRRHVFFDPRQDRPDEAGQTQATTNQERPLRHLIEASTKLPDRV